MSLKEVGNSAKVTKAVSMVKLECRQWVEVMMKKSVA